MGNNRRPALPPPAYSLSRHLPRGSVFVFPKTRAWRVAPVACVILPTSSIASTNARAFIYALETKRKLRTKQPLDDVWAVAAAAADVHPLLIGELVCEYVYVYVSSCVAVPFSLFLFPPKRPDLFLREYIYTNSVCVWESRVASFSIRVRKGTPGWACFYRFFGFKETGW